LSDLRPVGVVEVGRHDALPAALTANLLATEAVAGERDARASAPPLVDLPAGPPGTLAPGRGKHGAAHVLDLLVVIAHENTAPVTGRQRHALDGMAGLPGALEMPGHGTSGMRRALRRAGHATNRIPPRDGMRQVHSAVLGCTTGFPAAFRS